MNTCALCNFTGSDVAVCSGCKCAFYCGPVCQRRDWQARHQDECHLLSEMCAIASAIIASDSNNISLIEGGVKRLPDTSPAELERDTLRQRQQEQQQQQPTTTIYQVNKDVMRLIALMVRLDGPTLAKTSRAFRALYQSIDWKTQLLTAWNAKPNEFAKPIGQWLQDYRVYLLYPELGLPERVVSRDQQERLAAIEAVRESEEEAFLASLDEQVAVIEREVFLDRFVALPRMADQVQQGIINLFMLYYMYQENSITHEGYCPADDGNEGNSSDEDADEDEPNFGPMRKITANLDIRPYRKITAAVPAFFPVEMLTAPLFDEYILGGADYTGPRPDCVLAMALASDVIRPLQDARRGAIDHSVSLAFVKNFPKALVKCSSIVNELMVTDCPQFSDASMQNVAKMVRISQARFYIHEDWQRFLIDMYATLPLLNGLYIGVPQSTCQLREIVVSPSVMRESPSMPGLYGACAPKGRWTDITLSKSDPYEGIEKSNPLVSPNRSRIVPPGPYAGMSYSDYTRRILLEAFSKEDMGLHARLLKSLENAGLMLSSPDQYKGENFAEDFVKAVEASGISPLRTDAGQTALPFRFWFYQGLPFYSDGQGIPSDAIKMCMRSAEARRGTPAAILLEEMAEAVCGWQVSVRNLNIMLKYGYQTRPKYDYATRALKYDRLFTGDEPLIRSYRVKCIAGTPLEIPWELFRELIAQFERYVATGETKFIRLYFVGWQGKLPAWLWLAPKELSAISCAETGQFDLPVQLMYHPGLASLTVTGNSFGQFNWEMVHVAPEGRPGQAPDGTFMHQYFHDFERLWMELTSVSVSCFPPLDLTTYNVAINLELKPLKSPFSE